MADTALSAGWAKVAFLDDRAPTMEAPLGLPVLGTLADLKAQAAQFSAAIVAIGESRRRLELLHRCRAEAFETVSIIHPKAFLSPHASLSAGCVLFAQSAVNAATRLGEACIVNTGATIDHDCVLGDAVHVCPGVHVAGNVRVGDHTWIGIGAVICEGLTIGRGVTIAAGAVVIANVADGSTVMGVPAKPKTGSCR